MRVLGRIVALLSLCCLFSSFIQAETCSGYVSCGDRHSNCSGALISPLRTGCKLGLACSHGQCINAEDLVEKSCSKDADCLSNIFSLRCISNTCKFFGFAGPGEQCAADYECYLPHGSSSNAKCNDGKCQSGNLNDPCFVSDERSCLPGLYCDNKAALCKEKLSEGADCEDENQCAGKLICFGDYGRAPQCQAQLPVLGLGETCDHSLRFCKSELFCVQGVCRSYESQGLSCNSTQHKDAGCDFGFSACQCNALTQSLQCEINPIASPYCTEQLKSLQKCMVKNQCTIEFEHDHFIEPPPNSCVNQHCRILLSQFYRCRAQVLFPTNGWDDKIAECGGWFFEYPARSITGAIFLGVIVTIFALFFCTFCAIGVSRLKRKNEYGLVSQFESQPMVDSDQEDELSDEELIQRF